MIYIIFGVHIITTIQVIRSTYVVQNIIQREHQKFKKTLCAGPQLTRSHGAGQYNFLFSHPPTLIALQQDRDISPNINWGKQRKFIFHFIVETGVKKLDFLQTFSVASNYILFRYLVVGIPPQSCKRYYSTHTML